MSARNLKVGDKKKKTSDAYVVVKFDRSKKKSKVVEGTLDRVGRYRPLCTNAQSGQKREKVRCKV